MAIVTLEENKRDDYFTAHRDDTFFDLDFGRLNGKQTNVC